MERFDRDVSQSSVLIRMLCVGDRFSRDEILHLEQFSSEIESNVERCIESACLVGCLNS